MRQRLLPSCLRVLRRMRPACLVCRLWRWLADQPSLLHSVVVSFQGDSWAQRYLDFAAWLPLHAAHMRQLSVRALSLPGSAGRPPSAENEASAFESTIGLLAACASARHLTSLSLTLGCEFQQGRWLPALRTLRSLSIQTL